jgi:hypothetical protein
MSRRYPSSWRALRQESYAVDVADLEVDRFTQFHIRT